MLLTRSDQPVAEGEWIEFLHEHDFGQLVAPGSSGGLPIVVPVHFRYRHDHRRVELHLHRLNPVWRAIEGSRLAMLAVVGADLYIPTYWNAEPDEQVDEAAPTSYYAAVQLRGSADIVDDSVELAELITGQLEHHQPEGRYGSIAPGTRLWPMLRGVRGLRLAVEEVQLKFKFGGNRTSQHRASVADRLNERRSPRDREVREFLLRRV